MEPIALHHVWNYTDVDRAFWEEHLADWLPERIVDAHVHVADPALLAFFIFRLRRVVGKESRWGTGVFGFLAGAAGLGIAVLIAWGLLITTIPAHLDVEAERASIYALTMAHVPLIVLEGIFTALVALFLHRVKPELLEN